MLTIINLPPDFASTTLGYVGTIYNDLSGIINLIIGVFLAVLVLEVFVFIIRK